MVKEETNDRSSSEIPCSQEHHLLNVDAPEVVKNGLLFN